MGVIRLHHYPSRRAIATSALNQGALAHLADTAMLVASPFKGQNAGYGQLHNGEIRIRYLGSRSGDTVNLKHSFDLHSPKRVSWLDDAQVVDYRPLEVPGCRVEAGTANNH